MGIQVELSQILLQPGHDDRIPLEIKNNMPFPIIIHPGVSMAQAVFFNTISPSSSPYHVSIRSKYPPYASDARSRYYFDPEYDKIRESLPTQRRFDWDYLLDILLLIAACLSLLSWVLSRFPDPALSSASINLSIMFFSVMSLVVVARVVRLWIKRR